MLGRLGFAYMPADPTHPARFFERFAGQEMPSVAAAFIRVTGLLHASRRA
jgi:hypothetical protein